MRQVKIIIEKDEDGYVAYPVGIKGVVSEKATPTKLRSTMSNLL